MMEMSSFLVLTAPCLSYVLDSVSDVFISMATVDTKCMLMIVCSLNIIVRQEAKVIN